MENNTQHYILIKARRFGYKDFKYVQPTHEADTFIHPPTFTDWDKECELLKEYLREKSDKFADNLIRQQSTFDNFKKRGFLIYNDTDNFAYKAWMDSPFVDNFENWKYNKAKQNRFFIPSYGYEIDKWGYRDES